MNSCMLDCCKLLPKKVIITAVTVYLHSYSHFNVKLYRDVFGDGAHPGGVIIITVGKIKALLVKIKHDISQA